MHTKISIIITTYNRKFFLSELLGLLYNQKIEKGLKIDIVVFNDGSSDGTEKLIGSKYPEIHLLKGDGNFWFTKSLNQACKYAIEHLNPDYILTLNDDVKFEHDFVHRLYADYLKIDNPKSIIGCLSVSMQNHQIITFAGYKT